MTELDDLVGQRFGRTTVVRRAPGGARARWECLCDCGKAHVSYATNLKRGRATSCGCYHKERISEVKTIHGMRHTSTYRSWAGMKNRCNNPNDPHFRRYGARGIAYQPSWESFSEFLSDMGEAGVGMSIERVDNDKGYSKENCVWASITTQARNKSCSKLDIDSACVIKTLVKCGTPQSKIASTFAVSKATIKDIAHGRTWRDATVIPH